LRDSSSRGKDVRTYVTLHVSSEGERASVITEKLKALGFESTLGTHDFMYKWSEKVVTPAMVIEFVDKVQERLRGCRVSLHFTTVR
jgi:hypothetical protein